VTGADLLATAVTELYSADPDEFVGRRGDLAARARAAGETAAAKQIAALRKPTQSAWVVNQLARSAPGDVAELARLGGQLREAQLSTDGEAIRELSQRRRQLVDGLVRQALTASRQRSPSAALRDEVAATLSAAVADPQVADKLMAGTLERAVRREGFGLAGVLTLVTSQPDTSSARSAGRPVGNAGREDGKAPQGRPGAGRERGPARLGSASPRGAEPAAPFHAGRERRRQDARAESERQRHQDAVAEAEREAAEAGRAAAAATAAEAEQEEAVRVLEEQLAEARVRLADTRAQARRLRAGQRRARQALGRLSR
jgi:hypothetical protein